MSKLSNVQLHLVQHVSTFDMFNFFAETCTCRPNTEAPPVLVQSDAAAVSLAQRLRQGTLSYSMLFLIHRHSIISIHFFRIEMTNCSTNTEVS